MTEVLRYTFIVKCGSPLARRRYPIVSRLMDIATRRYPVANTLGRSPDKVSSGITFALQLWRSLLTVDLTRDTLGERLTGPAPDQFIQGLLATGTASET